MTTSYSTIRFTVRDVKGIPLAHGRTPDEALARAVGKGQPYEVERRLRDYPFTALAKVRVGA